MCRLSARAYALPSQVIYTARPIMKLPWHCNFVQQYQAVLRPFTRSRWWGTGQSVGSFHDLPDLSQGSMRPYLLGLPLELLQRIVSYLELDDFHSVTRTCKEFETCLASEGLCQETLEVGLGRLRASLSQGLI